MNKETIMNILLDTFKMNEKEVEQSETIKRYLSNKLLYIRFKTVTEDILKLIEEGKK